MPRIKKEIAAMREAFARAEFEKDPEPSIAEVQDLLTKRCLPNVGKMNPARIYAIRAEARAAKAADLARPMHGCQFDGGEEK